MKKLFILALSGLFYCSTAQTYEIQYTRSFEGKVRNADNPSITYVNADKAVMLNQKILQHSASYPYVVTTVSHPTQEVIKYAYLGQNKVISTRDDSLLSKYQFKLSDETKKILGYTVHKATTTINSNAMEVWYTKDLNLYGGPGTLGNNLGLVLEVVRNGSSSTKAQSIKKVKRMKADFLFKDKNIQKVDPITYQDMIWKSRFTTIPVFTNEIINFVGEPQSDTKVKRFAHGTIILKKVKFPSIGADQSVFVKLKEQSNGDAYDRTGSVFIIPEGRKISLFDALEKGSELLPLYTNGNGKEYKGMTLTPDFMPIIELMRFYTPFGISHFNDKANFKGKKWEDFVTYRQDISDLKPAFSGKEVWVGAYIGNYDKGGHKVSLEFTIHDEGMDHIKDNFVLPLFATINVMENAGQGYPTLFSSPKGLQVSFTLKKDLKNAKLRYITTGHGGWGNGDEFVPKSNTIYLDGKKVFAFTPWRTDCGSYRMYNPVSGNFRNGLSSSDLSRSNWCPGTTTNPNFIDLGDLKAGKHSIQVVIPQGKPEGSSISYWNISGALTGTRVN